ncbi:phage tail protein [Cronobacter turicensis]|nr:phage tail protein [Cronobacter turicensis]
MTAKYFALLTNQGAARLANAAALGTKLNLTQLAVGDGGGSLPVPDTTQTRLINEKRRAPLNMLSVDPVNTSQIIAEQIIPESEGGYWIREIGLYDDAGVLIAVANCPETYKPQLQEGSGRTQTIRLVLIVSATDAVALKIDPSVVLATRKYADDKAIEVKLYIDQLMEQHLKAADPHTQYAPKASPVFTGKPTAPTPAQTSNDAQLATTAFVKAAVAALVASSPAALDTLSELAAALGNDANFAATMTKALAEKQPLDATLTALAGLATGANKLPYFTGTDTVGQTDLTAVGRDILSKSTLTALQQYLGVDRVTQGPTATSLLTQNGIYQFSVFNGGGWGLFRVSDSANIPLSVGGGGTGAQDAEGARANLGLAYGSLLPVGIPVPWPGATPPSGWLKCNGATFTAAQYPKLAIAYPGLVLPDLRGQFLRGWDDGKGVDAGRVLLSGQADAIRNIYGNFLGYDYAGDSANAWTGAFSYGPTTGNQAASTGTAAREVSTAFSAANVVPTATENRPVNVAFNFIVRAE